VFTITLPNVGTGFEFVIPELTLKSFDLLPNFPKSLMFAVVCLYEGVLL